MKDTLSISSKNSTEVYIDFLAKTLGASKEEILEVAKRSGVSTRRIAEYLIKQNMRASEFSDDE